MADYLLDTTTFSFLMRDDAKVRARINALAPGDRVVVCSLVRGEILHGIERLAAGKRRADLETKAGHLFSAIPCESVPSTAADADAQLKRGAERPGTPLDENDLWIAATASNLGATLVTADADFSRLPGLPPPEDWTL